MITWLASYPRSGNSWCREILAKSYQLNSVEMYKEFARPAFEAWFAQAAAEPTRHFVKTHDLPGNDEYPAIYIVRDGRDALVSYAWYRLQVEQNIPKHEIPPRLFRDTLEAFIDARGPFGNWSANVNAWSRRPNTHLIRYEDMIKAPARCVGDSLRNLGVNATYVQEPPTFEEMKGRHPIVVRRGKVGSWREEFPEDLLPCFWRIHGETMNALGYPRVQARDIPWRLRRTVVNLGLLRCLRHPVAAYNYFRHKNA